MYCPFAIRFWGVFEIVNGNVNKIMTLKKIFGGGGGASPYIYLEV